MCAQMPACQAIFEMLKKLNKVSSVSRQKFSTKTITPCTKRRSVSTTEWLLSQRCTSACDNGSSVVTLLARFNPLIS